MNTSVRSFSILCLLVALPASAGYFLEDARSVDTDVVPNASYFVYENPSMLGKTYAKYVVPYQPNSHRVTFYTFDGNPLRTITYHCGALPYRHLDPAAPRPQPTWFTIKYLAPMKLMGSADIKKAGYYVIFYDKNNYPITSFLVSKQIVQADRAQLQRFLLQW